MRSNRTAFVIAALMVMGSIGAVVARPDLKTMSRRPEFSLETMVPRQFGDWREQPQLIEQVVNPQVQAALDQVYSQVLQRVYVNPEGYRIMLSIAYGGDHRGSLRTHEPEYCYPGQGFIVRRREVSDLVTPFGVIPVRRLFATKGPRQEPVTYWIKVGDTVVRPWQSKLVELSYVITRRIPDGLLFRVSSIDPDQARANRVQRQFVDQLLQTLSPPDRKRLSGLGDSDT